MPTTTKKKKRGKGFHVRFRPQTIEWLEGLIDDEDEEKDCVPAVVRGIVEEARRNALPQPGAPTATPATK